METYETLPVEIAVGIHYPMFNLPTPDPAGAYLYRPSDPIPQTSQGGPQFSSPAIGAESLYTNKTEKAAEPPSAKLSGKPLAKESP